MDLSTTASTSPIRPRSPELAYEAPFPQHWFAENPVLTHLANGVNLLFPAGERFFVRSVHRFLDEVTDEGLRAQVKGFFGQEGRHAREHERFFDVLEAQGYDVRRFLALYERIAYGLIEKVSSAELALATTAACEHFTAMLAQNVLEKRLLDLAHPSVRKLLMWHAAEEIEHRAVAFDVLQQVRPGYGLRMAGLAMATATLGGFWAMATASLLVQERQRGTSLLPAWRRAKKAREERQHGGVLSVFARGIREYMRPDFHPSQSDIDRLATDYLASVGLA